MKKIKIKVGDTVRILAGDDKGQEGSVKKIDFNKNRAIIDGINLVSKHQKPNAKNPQGGIVKKEAPIHVSNLALIDTKSGTTTRVGYEMREGVKVRVSKKSNEVI